MSRTALVIGGGIAGPATAMALRKAGIEAVIYEAHPEGADGAGVFLTLGSNGIDALKAIGADGPATEAGFATPVLTLRSAKGKELGISKISSAGLAPSMTIRRADLYSALHAEAVGRGVQVVHGKRLAGAEQTGEPAHRLRRRPLGRTQGGRPDGARALLRGPDQPRRLHA
jgi:2-polyprenyl-6-methoxyphenol hydroxylase-like FAD-dependent oxidoreductase